MSKWNCEQGAAAVDELSHSPNRHGIWVGTAYVVVGAGGRDVCARLVLLTTADFLATCELNTLLKLAVTRQQLNTLQLWFPSALYLSVLLQLLHSYLGTELQSTCSCRGIVGSPDL
jgi:hypothetical protein